MTWDNHAVGRLRELRSEGLSFAKVAKQIGCSRSAVIGAHRRHVRMIPDDRTAEQRRGKKFRTSGKFAHRTDVEGRWSDRALTETWAERKLRKQGASQ